jgi:hypothetical protein
MRTAASQDARCITHMRHSDGTVAQCVLDRSHRDTDSDHVDAHGHTAQVLVHHASIADAQRVQDLPAIA